MRKILITILFGYIPVSIILFGLMRNEYNYKAGKLMQYIDSCDGACMAYHSSIMPVLNRALELQRENDSLKLATTNP